MSRRTAGGEQARNATTSRTATLSLVAFDELQDVVTIAVASALEDFKSTAANDALLTSAQLAQRIQVSVATVRTLRDAGMPTVMVLQSPRFDWAAVKAWLIDNGKTAGSCVASKAACPNLDGPTKNADVSTVERNLHQVAGAHLDVEAAQ